MRMGEGEYKLPDMIPTRGHLLLQGKKISKSRHWSITVRSFLEVFPADYLRFYLTRIIPLNQSDADFNWQEFRDKINNELVANIGNFAHRSLVFVKTKHDGVVPPPHGAGPDEDAIAAELGLAVEETGRLVEGGHYDRALKRVLEYSAKCNQYFQKKAPWEGRPDEPTAMYYSCNLVAGLATILSPFLPFAASEMWRQLGFDGRPEEGGWRAASRLRVEAGRKIGKPKPIFVRVEEKDIQAVQKLAS
jgi:methionyl-tRNA synthetase